MRATFLLSLSILFTAPLAADNPASPPSESVRFDGQELVLAWQGENPGERIKEFLPAGQKLESWTQLASIREYANIEDPQTMAGEMLRKIAHDYPLARSAILVNATTGEVIIDFVVWPPDASLVEFNVFKFSRRPGGGVIAEQYAVRDYQDPIKFLQQLKPLRERAVDLMTQGLQPGTAPAKTN